MSFAGQFIDDPKWEAKIGRDPVKLAQARDKLWEAYLHDDPQRQEYLEALSQEEADKLRGEFDKRLHKQHKDIFEVETWREKRKWTEKQLVGGGGVMQKMGPDIEREKEIVHKRPVYDPETERFLADWGRGNFVAPEVHEQEVASFEARSAELMAATEKLAQQLEAFEQEQAVFASEVEGFAGDPQAAAVLLEKERLLQERSSVLNEQVESTKAQWEDLTKVAENMQRPFSWESMDQQDLEGVSALLAQAYPQKVDEFMPKVRERAKTILEERGQLIPGEDENMRALIANELARRTAAAGGAAGGSVLVDAMERSLRYPPLMAPGPDLPRVSREEAAEMMNRITGLSEENRRLFRLAYDNDTALTEMLSTGAAWVGGANALFRRSLGRRLVPRIDPETGARMLDKAGKPLMSQAAFRVNPISWRGIVEGAAFDTAFGAALGPEYAPSFIAEAMGMEPGRVSSALESGAIGAVMGTMMRQLSNAAVLRRARQMPQFADVADVSAAEFRKIFRQRMPEILEDAKHAAAQKAQQGAAEAIDVDPMTGAAVPRRPDAPVSGRLGGAEPGPGAAEVPHRPTAPAAKQAERVALPEVPEIPESVPVGSTPIAAQEQAQSMLLGQEQWRDHYSRLFRAMLRRAPEDPQVRHYAERLAGMEAARPEWRPELEPLALPPSSSVPSAPATKGATKAETPARRRSWFGPLPDGGTDLINVIEDMGGIRSPQVVGQVGGEYDGFAEAMNRGPGRLLISRRPTASTIDQILDELRVVGYDFDSPDSLYNAIQDAFAVRSQMRAKMERDKSRDVFYRTALENKGGRKLVDRPEADEILNVDDLSVGDKFRIKGEEVRVTDIDPDTEAVIVDDGPRYGYDIELPPGETVYPDKGSMRRAPRSTEFVPEEESVEVPEGWTPERWSEAIGSLSPNLFQSPLLKTWAASKVSLPTSTVVLQEIGDFFETFARDADLVSEIVGVVKTSWKGVPMAGIPRHALGTQVRKLADAGHPVVLLARASGKKGSPPRWEMTTPESKADEPFSLERLTPEEQAAEKARLAEQAARQADREKLEQMQQKRLTGDSSDVGQGRLFTEDEDLFSGPSAERGSSGFASMGDRADARGSVAEPPPPPPAGAATSAASAGPEHVESLVLELPEMVELARMLLAGRFPRVLERLRAGRGMAQGVFKPGTPGDIELRADLFKLISDEEKMAFAKQAREEVRLKHEQGELKQSEVDQYVRDRLAQLIENLMEERIRTNPEQAVKTLAHEIGHLVDHLPDFGIESRGNIFGRLATLKRYLKHTLPRDPTQPHGEPLSPKERRELRKEAERQMKEENWREIVEEVFVEEPEWAVTKITAEDVRKLFGIEARETMPELYEWFAAQTNSTKKEIVKAAMRGVVDERLAHLEGRRQVGTKTVKKTVTRRAGREPTKEEMEQRFRELLREELLRRNLEELRVIREELMELSTWWRGSMGELGSSYYKYRSSGVELYADAFSVLVNNPAALRKRAPNYWQVFHAYLGEKPMVKKVWDQIQDDIKSGRIYRDRVQRLRDSWATAEQRSLERASLAKRSMQEKMDSFRLIFDRQFGPIYRRMEQHGRRTKGAFNQLQYEAHIKNFIYRTTAHEQWFRRLNLEVLGPLTEDNLDWVDLAEAMFHMRVIHERTELANPHGWTPKASLERMEGWEQALGPERWARLTQAREKYRQIYQEEVLDKIRELQIFDEPFLEKLDDAVTYATFSVSRELESADPNTIEGALSGRYGQEASSRIHRQIGTFQGVMNPATATAEKAISLMSMAYREAAKRAVVDALQAMGDPMISPAKWHWSGKRRVPTVVKNDRVGTIVYLHNGELNAWYVPRTVSDMFEAVSMGPVGSVMSPLWAASNAVKSIFAPLNYGFWLVGHARDIRGWSRRMPGTVAEHNLFRFFPIVGWLLPSGSKRLIKYYGSSARASFASVRGRPNKLADEALKRKMFISRAEDRGWTPTDERGGNVSIERRLSRFGIKPVSWRNQKDVDDLRRFLNRFLEFWHGYKGFGQFFERIPKIAAMQMLDEHYPEMPEAEKQRIVHQWGGSPDFLQKGVGNPMLDMVMPFLNPIVESKRSEARAWKRGPLKMGLNFLMITGPATIAAWMLEKGFFNDALESMLGEDNAREYQEMMRAIPAADKARFHVIPLAWADRENRKVMYLTLHLEEEERLMNAVLRAMLNSDAKLDGVGEAAAFAGGELPTGNPIYKVGKAWFEYMVMGRNPYDSFYNRPIIEQDRFESGEGSAKELAKWSWNSLSGNLFGRFRYESIYDPGPTAMERFLNAPIASNVLGRWVRISNRGLFEEADKITDPVAQERARMRVIGREMVRKMLDGEEWTKSERELAIEDPYLLEYVFGRTKDVAVFRESIESLMLERAGSRAGKEALLEAWADQDRDQDRTRE